MDQEDKDGNQLWRVVVLSSKVENYLAEARKQGYNIKRFAYNYDKYKQELEVKVKLEHKIELLKVSTSTLIRDNHRHLSPTEVTSHSVSCSSLSCT